MRLKADAVPGNKSLSHTGDLERITIANPRDRNRNASGPSASSGATQHIGQPGGTEIDRHRNIANLGAIQAKRHSNPAGFIGPRYQSETENEPEKSANHAYFQSTIVRTESAGRKRQFS